MFRDAIKRWNRQRLDKKRLKKSGIPTRAIVTSSLLRALGSHLDSNQLGCTHLVVCMHDTSDASNQGVNTPTTRALFAALEALPHNVTVTVLLAGEKPIPCTRPASIVLMPPSDSELIDVNAMLAEAPSHAPSHVLLVGKGCIVEPYTVINMLKVCAAANQRALIEALHFPDELAKSFDPGTLVTDWVSRQCLLIPAVALQRPQSFNANLTEPQEADIDFAHRAQQAGFALKSCPIALVYAPALSQSARLPAETELLSVIIRFHDSSRLGELQRCLFSIACATYRRREAIIVCQSFDPGQLTAIQAYAKILRQALAIDIRIINPSLPAGVDHRSALINQGLSAAQGRYIAFLDYDDCIRPQAYAHLISALQSSQSQIAFGDIMTKRVAIIGPATIVRHKTLTWGRRNIFDLLYDNCCPIHSYVIDRAQVNASLLRFDETLSKYEDYEFLIQICTQYRTDFSLIHEVVGDYYIKEDGSNSVITSSSFSSSAKEAWRASKQTVTDRRDRTPIGPGALAQINELLESQNVPVLKEGATTRDVNLAAAELRLLA